MSFIARCLYAELFKDRLVEWTVSFIYYESIICQGRKEKLYMIGITFIKNNV